MQRGREQSDRRGSAHSPSASLKDRQLFSVGEPPAGRTIPSPQRWYICAHPAGGVKKSVAVQDFSGQTETCKLKNILVTAWEFPA